MGNIFDIINVPLGFLFRIIFMLVQNYGWALVFFTIITKLILLPLSMKQQKSMVKMQAIQPKLAELQRKYQYDKEKLNQETMKLYQQGGVNPMGGCLPLLIQLPLLIALYNIIRNPLTYVVQLGQYGLPTVQEVFDALVNMGHLAAGSMIDEINIAKLIAEHRDALTAVLPNLSGAMDINFWFYGLDLSGVPSAAGNTILLIIPVLAGFTTYLSTWLSQKISGNQSQQTSPDNSPASSMKMMNYIFPFMTAFFAYTMSAGLGVYWTLSNIIQIVQQYVLTNYYKKKDVAEAPKKEHFRERESKRRKK